MTTKNSAMNVRSRRSSNMAPSLGLRKLEGLEGAVDADMVRNSSVVIWLGDQELAAIGGKHYGVLGRFTGTKLCGEAPVGHDHDAVR
jgi:hypothetical protein